MTNTPTLNVLLTEELAAKIAASIRDEALEDAAVLIDAQDVDPAFKLRMSCVIRSLKKL